MAENSETDWILINLKFKGKCVECGKEITSGRALWSRSAKSIKHLDCAVGKANQLSSNEESGSHNQEPSTHKRYRKTIVQRCFICGKEEPVEDEYHSNEYPYLVGSRSQSYICQSCLDSKDAFEAYRQTFLQKIKRYMKPSHVYLTCPLSSIEVVLVFNTQLIIVKNQLYFVIVIVIHALLNNSILQYGQFRKGIRVYHDIESCG